MGNQDSFIAVALARFLADNMKDPFLIEIDDSLEIAPHPVWVCLYECYLHIAPSIADLDKEVRSEFRYEKHLVG